MDFSDDYSFTEFCDRALSPLISFDEEFKEAIQEQSTSTLLSRKPLSSSFCNCKRSKCLKMYCECFAKGKKCEDCNCTGCLNNDLNSSLINQAKTQVLRKNPLAFASQPCRCAKSNCQKKYCKCFTIGNYCTDDCECTDCHNR